MTPAETTAAIVGTGWAIGATLIFGLPAWLRTIRARNEARNARQRTIRNYRDQLTAFDPDTHRTVQR